MKSKIVLLEIQYHFYLKNYIHFLMKDLVKFKHL